MWKRVFMLDARAHTYAAWPCVEEPMHAVTECWGKIPAVASLGWFPAVCVCVCVRPF